MATERPPRRKEPAKARNGQLVRKLRARIRELEQERDDYRKSILAMLREEFVFTEQHIRELDKNGIPLEDILKEIRKL